MSDAVDSGIPIVLVQGSGGAADFMVDLWKQLHGRFVRTPANLSQKTIDKIYTYHIPRVSAPVFSALVFLGRVHLRYLLAVILVLVMSTRGLNHAKNP
jgi:hypothetical protein